jgi:hypothetical protein
MKPNKEKLSSVTTAAILQRDPTTQKWTTQREDILQSLTAKPFVAPRVMAAMVRIFEGLMVALVALVNLARFPGLEHLDFVTVSAIVFAAIAFPAALQVAGAYRLNVLLSPLPRLTSIVATCALRFRWQSRRGYFA